MKRIIVILAFTAFLLSQQAEITNVQVAQRTDGSKLVDITYDLSTDAIFTEFMVTIETSFDGGSNWDEGSSVTGDVNMMVTPGEGKVIVWNLPSGQFSNDVKVRLKAISTITSATIPFEMVDIPAGNYTYGEAGEILSIDYDYQISKYPITVAQYIVYLIEAYELGQITISEGGWSGDDLYVYGFFNGNQYFSSGTYLYLKLINVSVLWNGTTFISPEGTGDNPVTNITFFGAIGFAQRYGAQLPNPHEWEKAARGSTGYEYPFGNSVDGSQANYYNSGDPWDNGITPVGFYNGQNYEGFQTTDSPSPYGVYDMVGNVSDMVDHFIVPYEGNYNQTTCGGNYNSDTNDIQVWQRQTYGMWDSAQMQFNASQTAGFRIIKIQ